MAKLPILSAHKIIKTLKNAGFEAVSQKGSHIKMKKKTTNETFTAIIPNYIEVPAGTLKSIIRQQNLGKE